MRYVVVAYDVSDDRRRAKVCDLLSALGQRVNYSVFECLITERQLSELKEKLNKLVPKEQGCVVYYLLCRHCVSHIDRRGAYARPEVVRVV